MADGSWCTVPSDMERMANSYFKEIFTKDSTLDPQVVLDNIVPKVLAEMNDTLCKPYSEEGISNALFQIGPLKAPGCDGFPARFLSKELGCFEGGNSVCSSGVFCYWHHARWC